MTRDRAARVAYTALVAVLLALIVHQTVTLVDAFAGGITATQNSVTTDQITDGTIVNADVNASAGIVYSKLNLSGGIVNADVNASAGIVYSKLNLSASLVVGDLAAALANRINPASPTNGGVLYGDGTQSQVSAAGTSGQLLKSNGAAAPSWVNPSSLITFNGDFTSDTTNVTSAAGLAFSGLIVDRQSVTTVGVTATSITLVSASGETKTFRNVAENADITASGAGGLDTGAEANQLYFTWLIGKADGTIDALISASATAPLIPVGYQYSRRVNAFNNDTNIVWFYQFGRELRTDRANANNILVNAGTATSNTDINMSGAAPSTAVGVVLEGQPSDGGGNGVAQLFIVDKGSGLDVAVIQISTSGTSGFYFSQAILARGTSGLRYRVSASDTGSIRLVGWSDNI